MYDSGTGVSPDRVMTERHMNVHLRSAIIDQGTGYDEYNHSAHCRVILQGEVAFEEIGETGETE